MESKVIKVFYGEDLLPYKDSAREVHYPITGSTFACSNKTNTIRFYVDQIGGTVGVSWVVVSKLPNGTLGYEPVSNVGTDSELGENYIEFELSSYYTQYKGVVKLALRGYNGNIAFDEASGGVYTISGTPLIEVSGTIDVAINYSPFANTGTEILPTDVDRILAALSGYTPIGNSIVVVQTKPNASSLSNFDEGQLFYVKNDRNYYILSSGSLVLYYIGALNGNDIVAYGSKTIAQVYSITNGAWFSGYNLPVGSTPYPNALYFMRVKTTDNGYRVMYFALTEEQSIVYGFLDNTGSSSLYNCIDSASTVKDTVATQSLLSTTLADYYNKTQIDTYLAGKVDKTSSANKVYGTNGMGEQIQYDVSIYANSSIPLRNINGQLVVPETPANVQHAASKGYVDAFGKTLTVDINATTYVMTLTLKDNNGNTLSTGTVDLPLETMVVDAQYDDDTKSIILTLQNGTTVSFSVADLVSGLVSYSDFTITGGYVSKININGNEYGVAQSVSVNTTPKVVQSTTDLPQTNDGFLYLVLDDGYLYYYDNGWQQGYLFGIDPFTYATNTEVENLFA